MQTQRSSAGVLLGCKGDRKGCAITGGKAARDGIPPPAVRVIAPEAGDLQRVRARYRLPSDPFVLVVGALDRRKNSILVLEALRRLRITPVHAVFAGPPGDVGIAREAAGRAVGDRVHVLGYVPDLDLAALYREAAALVFPSRYEGFGLPMVEAFASGTPVIASNAGALPEVAGDAALLMSPDDPDGLVRAIRSVLAEPWLRERLVARGRERVAQGFSEEVIAGQLRAVYEAVLCHGCNGRWS